MPAAKPTEFRRRAVNLTRSGQQPVVKVASDLGLSGVVPEPGDGSGRRRCRLARGAEQRRTQGTGRAASPDPGAGDGGGDSQAGQRLLRPGERPPKTGARLVQELVVDGVLVAATCQVLGISRSGFYEAAGRAPSARQVADQALTVRIVAIHHGSRATYGAPRIHAGLRLGLGITCGRKRVARPMRTPEWSASPTAANDAGSNGPGVARGPGPALSPQDRVKIKMSENRFRLATTPGRCPGSWSGSSLRSRRAVNVSRPTNARFLNCSAQARWRRSNVRASGQYHRPDSCQLA